MRHLTPQRSSDDTVLRPTGPGVYAPRQQPSFLANGGAIGAMMRNYNWDNSPLGQPNDWPPCLQTTINIMLHSAFPMFVWWGSDDLINLYNEAYSHIMGRKHPAGFGRPARESWPEIWPEVSAMAKSVFRSKRPVFKENLRLQIDRDGAAKDAYFTFSYSPVLDDDGHVLGMLCIVIETTGQVLAQRQIDDYRAKDEFISLASHQLRTPATGVKQYLGMLLGDFAGQLTDDQRLLAQHAYDSNDRQLDVVTDLLSVAQADAGRIVLQTQPVELVEFIYSIIDEQASKFVERGQTIEFRHASTACTAIVDRSRMRMVLENLVDNASKYTPQGKKVTISLTQPSEAQIRITVKDQGVGIDQRDLSTIFDKFTRVANPLSEAVGGSGLGLYLVKKIVELHHGRISVVSQPGAGSRFAVTLLAGS